jgi:hypothetical protein
MKAIFKPIAALLVGTAILGGIALGVAVPLGLVL